MFAWSYEDVAGRNDVDEGQFCRVSSWEPYCHWDVVSCASEVDGEDAVDAEEEVGSTGVVGVDIVFRLGVLVSLEGGRDVWIDEV
jgi:hypothetical protein